MITLYTLSDCPRCVIVKQMLDTHNVQYNEIQDNKQLMIDKGFIEAPVIEVDDRVIETYTSVLAWLEDNNYYSL